MKWAKRLDGVVSEMLPPTADTHRKRLIFARSVGRLVGRVILSEFYLGRRSA